MSNEVSYLATQQHAEDIRYATVEQHHRGTSFQETEGSSLFLPSYRNSSELCNVPKALAVRRINQPIYVVAFV
ncbi:MAG: hypothetical protein NVS4B8_12260 [Herpetosiphon sp.]